MEPQVDVRAHISAADRRDALLHDVQLGLTAVPKTLPPIWFYDEVGSRLFDEITRLDEYYPTRAERSILVDHAQEIAELTGASTLVELGSGTSEKTLLLLGAMARAGQLAHFIPFDVSEEVLRSAAVEIAGTYEIPVTAVVGDFHRHLPMIPGNGDRLIAFLGGTIGNLAPRERRRFLFDLEATMASDDWLLLGTDLEKDVPRLIRAYDDATGVTADFNRNVLAVLNRELLADFDLDAFDHVAVWNEGERWMEMRLRARSKQLITIKDLDCSFVFDEGEELLTEISAKFTRDRVEQELIAANFVIERTWTDRDGDFLLTLAHPYC